MEAQKSTVDILTSELRRLRRENLKLKMHMQIMLTNPETRTAQKLRDNFEKTAVFDASVLYLN